MRWGGMLLALMAEWVAAPSLACVPPPPLVLLPGESPKAFRERDEARLLAETTEQRRLVQSNLLEQSKAAFVGVVTQSHDFPIDRVKGHEVTVRPLQAIKGALPDQPVILRDSTFTDCGMAGGGSATSAQPGDYVIVFAGLAPNQLQGPNLGIMAKESQLPELLGALAHYGLVSHH